MVRHRTLLIAVIIAIVALASAQSLNVGLGFPANGPCTPSLTSPGICNNSGVLSTYDITGKITPIGASAKGDKGDKGDPGQQGPQGVQGIQGVQGSYPTSFTLICDTGLGGAGHTAKCHVTVP